MEGCVTLAIMVLVGPVLKKRQKQVRKISTHKLPNTPSHSHARNGIAHRRHQRNTTAINDKKPSGMFVAAVTRSTRLGFSSIS
jgi:hypothetical protein